MLALNMEFTDVVRSSALVVAFVLLVVGERRSWLTADALASVGFGLGFLLMPRTMMGFMLEGDQDVLHAELLQLLGVHLLCQAILPYMTRDTRDGTVPITLMMSRIFSASVLILAQAATHWGTTRGKGSIDYNSQHIYFAMLGTALWATGHLIHLLRSQDFSTYPQYNIRINTHLRVDAWINLLSGVLFLAFPEMTLSLVASTPRDAVHVHVTRVLGIFDIGATIVALQATGFLHEHDKKHYLLSRLLVCVACVALGFIQILLFKTWTVRQVGLAALTMLPYVINAILGFFAGGTATYKTK